MSVREPIPFPLLAIKAKGVERAPVAWLLGFLGAMWFIGAILGSAVVKDMDECDKSPPALMIFTSLLLSLFFIYAVFSPGSFTWFLMVLSFLLCLMVLGVFTKSVTTISDKSRTIYKVFLGWNTIVIVISLLLLGGLMVSSYVEKSRGPLQPKAEKETRAILKTLQDKLQTNDDLGFND